MLALFALPLPVAAEAALPAGVSALPEGVVRVAFRPGEAALPEGAGPALAALGARLAARPAGAGRVTVEGQASGPADDPSTARRLSLARAQAVRAALVAGGIAETRVDVRPLGRTAAGLDAADILPPEAPRSGQAR